MLIDSERLKQAILTTMPERLEVLLIVDNQPDAVVRCKDCTFRGDATKCIVAHITKDTGLPLFIFDKHGEWYCADGRRKGDR